MLFGAEGAIAADDMAPATNSYRSAVMPVCARLRQLQATHVSSQYLELRLPSQKFVAS